MFALAGCANTDDGSTGTDSEGNDSASLVPAAEGTTEYPLTLTTHAGDTVLEERPERIATIGFNTNLDALESLGVTPVYAITDEEWEWRDQDWHSQIEYVDTATRRDPVNVEAIAATNPDLIVAVNGVPLDDVFDQLSDIAPIVGAEELEGFLYDWRDTQRLVGEALDLSEAAEELITEAENAIAETAADHPEFEGKTITMAYDYGSEYGLEYYTAAGSFAESIMLDLGFEPNPLAENFSDDSVISEENQELLDADVLLVIHADDETREAREADALFQSIPAVSEGRYVPLTFNDAGNVVSADGTELPNAVWVMRNGASPLSLPWGVDVIANQWLAEIDLS
ncbi:MAG: ABC transporter substrate-binding protein [Micrococcaceae bacterium]